MGELGKTQMQALQQLEDAVKTKLDAALSEVWRKGFAGFVCFNAGTSMHFFWGMQELFAFGDWLEEFTLLLSFFCGCRRMPHNRLLRKNSSYVGNSSPRRQRPATSSQRRLSRANRRAARAHHADGLQKVLSLDVQGQISKQTKSRVFGGA